MCAALRGFAEIGDSQDSRFSEVEVEQAVVEAVSKVCYAKESKTRKIVFMGCVDALSL